MAEWAYNPITGNLDRIGEGGGGGGNITITGDSGPPLNGNSFDIVGQDAGSAPVVTVDTSTGDVVIANNAYGTPYVVDQSVAPGLKGTFATIQAALDAAVVDGMSYTNPKIILIRTNGLPYIEDLVIPGGAYFMSFNQGGEAGTFIQPTTIQGSHTVDDLGIIYAKGIYWTNDGTADMFTSGASALYFMVEDCSFTSPGTALYVNSTAGILIQFKNCSFGPGSTLDTPKFSAPSGRWIFQNCDLSGSGISGGATVNATNTNGIGKMTFSAGIPILNNCLLSAETANVEFNALATGGTLTNCQFVSNGLTSYAIEGTQAGYIRLQGCRILQGFSGPLGFYDPSLEIFNGALTQSGNVINSAYSTAIDWVCQGFEGYLGILDTSSPRTVTIAALTKNYMVYVADESGGAGTNNITVNGAGGVTINGNSSDVIDTNFGAKLYYSPDGVNFIVLGINSATGGGGSITLNAESGPALSGTSFDIVGGKAGVVNVMESESVAGDMVLFNNSWVSPYVVDPSTTSGLKGTFTTIQAAIDQAVLDGCTFANTKTGVIQLRPGVITETGVIIPDGSNICIKGNSPSGRIFANNPIQSPSTTIVGSIIVGDACAFYMEDVYIYGQDGTDPCSLLINNVYTCTIRNCILSGFSVYSVVANSGTQNIVFDGVTTLTESVFYSPTDQAGLLGLMKNCFLTRVTMVENSCFRMEDTTLAEIIILNDSAYVEAYNISTKLSNQVFVGNSSAASIIDGFCSRIDMSGGTSFVWNMAAPLYLGNASRYDKDGTLQIPTFANPAAELRMMNTMMGNVNPSKTISSDYSCSSFDRFIFTDSTSNPIDLNLSELACDDQEITVKDFSGTALTNTITIAVPGGLIDGNSIYILNTAFQSATFKKMGLNYYVI